MHLRRILPVEQAEQEHALAESRKHAAAAQTHFTAELEAAHAKLAAAAEQLEQQRLGHAASVMEINRAATRSAASLQVISCSACICGRS